MEENEEREDRVIREILEWAFCVIIAIAMALATRYYIITSSIVQQDSMYPTLKENQRIILSRLTRTKKGEYNRGDIITFEAPSEIKKGTEVDVKNTVAIYNYEPEGIFNRFVYYVLEFKKTSYIKRIVGLPGERITIEDGKVYINGKEYKEDYLKEGTTTKAVYYNDLIVPEGCVYVLGDNRDGSMDSRTFGCIPIEKIEGKVKLRYWPLNAFGKVK